MTSPLDRRHLIALLAAMSAAPLGHAAGSKADSDKDDKKKDKDGDEEPLVCAEEVIGTWTTGYDGHAFRAYDLNAEITWKIQTHLDPVVTTGFFMGVTRPRRKAGYVGKAELALRYNPPKITLKNSHGKEYHAFGKALSHDYSRSAGFGTRRIWVEKKQFWFPHEDDFTVQVKQNNPRHAMTFEKQLVESHESLRIELYVPMYSSVDPIAEGDLKDTAGLVEAVRVAAKMNHGLYGEGAACRMPVLNLHPDPKADKKKDSGGH